MELNGHKAFLKKAPVATIIIFLLKFGKHFHHCLIFMGKTLAVKFTIAQMLDQGQIL